MGGTFLWGNRKVATQNYIEYPTICLKSYLKHFRHLTTIQVLMSNRNTNFSENFEQEKC